MRIGGASVYCPRGRLTAEAWLGQGQLSHEEYEQLKQAGIRSVAVDDETPAPRMMERVMEQLLVKHRLPPERIKYVLVPYLYYSFPWTMNVFAAMRERFGLEQALCFSVRDLLCSNVLMAMHIGSKLLERFAGPDDLAVVLAVEKCLLPDQRFGGGHFITGDGAAAVFIGSGPRGDKLLAFRSAADLRTLQQGKMRDGRDEVPDYFYYVNLVKTIRFVLSEAQLEIEDIRLIIPNNIAVETWTLLAKLMKIERDRIYTEGLADSGHINNCDLLHNWQRIGAEGLLAAGDYYLLLTLGSGGVICCAVCQRDRAVPDTASGAQELCAEGAEAFQGSERL
ncbi:hypothetical protein XYCOK13_21480 [Xylanibacillus composti]|uniref:Beta-ketoacyl-[acyl-carrier-protein] synthase III C-terminal domain-containing protein n=2 Tax=Xylanibacillus composti TaxID=1572762 RepID=A0A8J4H5P7_9BACL|nr:hypothetical protein XYCOK13_21480 [Xylanibacillus composti]